jgi:hypothetical protein
MKGTQMPKLLVENLTDAVISVGIEPWADSVVLAPDAKAEFDYDEPAEIAFSIMDDGPSVSIVSDRVHFSANGREKTYCPPENW